MPSYFVTRHPGALAWARQQQITVDQQISHLDLNWIQPGDQVLGTLPVHLAAAVCARGARYFHLTLELPEALRGRELTARQMADCGARLREYHVAACGE